MERFQAAAELPVHTLSTGHNLALATLVRWWQLQQLASASAAVRQCRAVLPAAGLTPCSWWRSLTLLDLSSPQATLTPPRVSEDLLQPGGCRQPLW